LVLTLVFLSAFGLSLVTTPLVRAAALRLGIVDRPERRKMHQVPVARMGGAAIVFSFLTTVVAVRLLAPGLFGDDLRSLTPLLVAALGVSLLGAYDDWKGLQPHVKFAFQALAAGILVATGVQAKLFTNPLGSSVELGWLGMPLTVLWIVGVTNAINLIDGLDGLASGVGTIASLSLCAVGAISDNLMVAVMALILAGASLGFLPFNLYPARIFLGDTGSMFLGFLLASFGVIGSLKASTATVLVLPIVVLGVPLFDTLWAILRRTRMKVSPFKADRDHIHHRLVRVGLHHRHVVFVLYFVCIFLGASAFVIVQLPYQTGLAFSVLLAAGGIIGVWTLKYIEDHLEERLGTAARGSDARVTPAVETAPALWQVSNGSRSGEGDYLITVCEVGRFRDGLASSQTFASVADQIREVLSRRIKVFAITAHLLEDRRLLLVLKTQRLDPDGLNLIREGVTRYFDEWTDRWGDRGAFPVFRWIRRGARSEESGRPHSRAAL
jgi:UDP-GlcNAc:undecaprenyl-phosphate/decaprenyl-phosphate GlcNAc-1-phosphate transferase